MPKLCGTCPLPCLDVLALSRCATPAGFGYSFVLLFGNRCLSPHLDVRSCSPLILLAHAPGSSWALSWLTYEDLPCDTDACLLSFWSMTRDDCRRLVNHAVNHVPSALSKSTSVLSLFALAVWGVSLGPWGHATYLCIERVHNIIALHMASPRVDVQCTSRPGTAVSADAGWRSSCVQAY